MGSGVTLAPRYSGHTGAIVPSWPCPNLKSGSTFFSLISHILIYWEERNAAEMEMSSINFSIILANL